VGKALREQGVRVEATTTRPERASDLLDEGVVDSVCTIPTEAPGDASKDPMTGALHEADAVFIAVAPGRSMRGVPDAYPKTYVGTVRRVLKGLEGKKKPTRVVYISSGSVYGTYDDGRIVTEDTPPANPSDNQQTLIEAEKLLLDAAKASQDMIRVSILRLAGVWGPNRPIRSVVERVAGQEVPGTGETFVHWTHLKDIVAASLFALRNGLEGAYNVCSPPVLRKKLYDVICELEGLLPVKWQGPGEGGEYTGRGGNKRLDCSKITGLGFKLLVPDTIQELQNAYQTVAD